MEDYNYYYYFLIIAMMLVNVKLNYYTVFKIRDFFIEDCELI